MKDAYVSLNKVILKRKKKYYIYEKVDYSFRWNYSSFSENVKYKHNSFSLKIIFIK